MNANANDTCLGFRTPRVTGVVRHLALSMCRPGSVDPDWNASGSAGRVTARLAGIGRPPGGGQDVHRALPAGTAAGGDPERRLQVPQVAGATLGGGPDLALGNGVANADVHGAPVMLDVRLI